MADFVSIHVSQLAFTHARRLVRCYLGLYVLLSFSCVQHVHARDVRRGRFYTPFLEARAT
jgi:hypothetical protein